MNTGDFKPQAKSVTEVLASIRNKSFREMTTFEWWVRRIACTGGSPSIERYRAAVALQHLHQKIQMDRECATKLAQLRMFDAARLTREDVREQEQQAAEMQAAIDLFTANHGPIYPEHLEAFAKRFAAGEL